MAEYRLSLGARRDLLDIAAYGVQRFGREQAIRYRDLLKQLQDTETGEECPESKGFFERLRGALGA